MAKPIFNPFLKFNFDQAICFLTGRRLEHEEQFIYGFPQWLLEKYDLRDKPFKLLDESYVTYKDIQLPASSEVADAFDNLDKKIEILFSEGYETVKNVDKSTLFLWISRVLYATIVFEIRSGIRQQQLSGEAFSFSQALVKKFGNLHLMMQSIMGNVELEGNLPYTIEVFRVNNAPATFNYRDEINTLTFSLQMEDFGIIACLQDNGANGVYHKEITDKIGTGHLHPIQFQEICGRFFYSNYLFNRLPEYNVMQTPEKTFVEPMPLQGMSSRPVFDHWQNKTYAQVLENFWKPWGFLLFEILKDPEKPMSFLTDDNGRLLSPEEIKL